MFQDSSSEAQSSLFADISSDAKSALSSDTSSDAQSSSSSDSPVDLKKLSDSFLGRQDSQKSSSAPSSTPPIIRKNLGLWGREQKLDLVKKAEGRSFRETERMLSEREKVSPVRKERVRFLGEGKVEVKAVIDLDCYRKLEELKNLLSHKSPAMSNGELLGILSDLGLQKYDPRKKGLGRKNTVRKNKRAGKILNKKKEKNSTPASESGQAKQDSPTPASELKQAKQDSPTPASELAQAGKDSLTKAAELAQIKQDSSTPAPESGQAKQDSPTPTPKLSRSKQEFPTPAPELEQKASFAPHKRHSRYIPAKIKRLVWMRDQGKCSYKTRTGKRCGSRHLLQIDHIQPVALGGETSLENLRLLCAGHNRFREPSTSRFQKRRKGQGKRG